MVTPKLSQHRSCERLWRAHLAGLRLPVQETMARAHQTAQTSFRIPFWTYSWVPARTSSNHQLLSLPKVANLTTPMPHCWVQRKTHLMTLATNPSFLRHSRWNQTLLTLYIKYRTHLWIIANQFWTKKASILIPRNALTKQKNSSILEIMMNSMIISTQIKRMKASWAQDGQLMKWMHVCKGHKVDLERSSVILRSRAPRSSESKTTLLLSGALSEWLFWNINTKL